MTRRYRTSLLSFLLTSLFSVPVLAQRTTTPSRPPAEVRGQVRLANDQTAPVGVLVLLTHQQGDTVAQTQTDSSGKFDFRFVEPAVYLVQIHALGYLDYASENLYLTQSPVVYLNPVLRVDPNYKNPFVKTAPGGVVSAEALNAPEEARKALASGEELLQKGTDYPRSIDFFKKAVKLYPKYSEAYLMMGLAHRAQGNYEDAAAALRKCIELNANSGPAYVALGEVQNERKDYAGAEKTLLKAVALNAESPEAQEELARTYWALGRWQEAEPHAAKAIALAPNSPPAHLIMGNIDLRKRDGQGALQQFEEYLKLDPQGPFAPNVRDVVTRLQKGLAQSSTRNQ